LFLRKKGPFYSGTMVRWVRVRIRLAESWSSDLAQLTVVTVSVPSVSSR